MAEFVKSQNPVRSLWVKRGQWKAAGEENSAHQGR
jgi:hypothetical protein